MFPGEQRDLNTHSKIYLIALQETTFKIKVSNNSHQKRIINGQNSMSVYLNEVVYAITSVMSKII